MAYWSTYSCTTACCSSAAMSTECHLEQQIWAEAQAFRCSSQLHGPLVPGIVVSRQSRQHNIRATGRRWASDELLSVHHSCFKAHTSLCVALQSVELQRLGIDNIPGQDGARIVHLNPIEPPTQRKFCSNVVRTAKCGSACPASAADQCSALLICSGCHAVACVPLR